MRIWRPHDNASLVPEIELVMNPDLLAFALMKAPKKGRQPSMSRKDDLLVAPNY